MDVTSLAAMLGVKNIESMSEETLNNIIAYKVQKLTIYASLTREEMCVVHNLVPRERAALIHM